MLLFKSFLTALSTYSVIPVPQTEWDERNMKYAICFFPAVGAVVGAVLWLWYELARFAGISTFFFAAAATCIPLLITGGIHMDGYMDTVDALSSHQSRQRKLEIMKDPNCGAFAVIYCGIFLLVYTGLMYELFDACSVAAVCPAFVLSRSLSGLCAVNMPGARKSGMLQVYTKNAEKRAANISLSLTAVAGGVLMILSDPCVGTGAVVFAAASVLMYRRIAMKQFGGATGDTAGFFLQICELMCAGGAFIGTFIGEAVI